MLLASNRARSVPRLPGAHHCELTGAGGLERGRRATFQDEARYMGAEVSWRSVRGPWARFQSSQAPEGSACSGGAPGAVSRGIECKSRAAEGRDHTLFVKAIKSARLVICEYSMIPSCCAFLQRLELAVRIPAGVGSKSSS